MNDDTIAAIATPPGEGGIAVVRVSGPDALRIADQVFQHPVSTPSSSPPNRFLVGYVVDNQEVIDQVLLLVMRAPHSYTCEDVVEFQGHGGGQCAQRILRCVCAAGARLAEPGEFTQRAFLNGRLDLVQAEAVLDLIHARSERAAAAAIEQLEGNLSKQFNAVYDRLIAVASDLEATLDFPEDELPDTVIPSLIHRLQVAHAHMDKLMATWDEGHLLRDGALIVISGKPNVGKSTLLNGLLGRDRAIVSSIPGTTRDTIEENGVINGIPVRWVDTAGLRETECEIERIGIQRAQNQMDKADLHLYMIDASQPIDQQVINRVSTLPLGKTLIIVNKMDRALKHLNIESKHPVERIIATESVYIERVKESINTIVLNRTGLHEKSHAAISERHRQSLDAAQREVEGAIDMLSIGCEDTCVLASSRVRVALEAIGEVLGRQYHSELLDQIFARFCIGK